MLKVRGIPQWPTYNSASRRNNPIRRYSYASRSIIANITLTNNTYSIPNSWGPALVVVDCLNSALPRHFEYKPKGKVFISNTHILLALTKTDKTIFKFVYHIININTQFQIVFPQV
jgi:hypothetical protein